MTQLHAFFRGGDSHLGMFYPSGYLIAIFPTLDVARKLERDLSFSGTFPEGDVMAASGEEVLKHDREDHSGPWNYVMTGLSRLFGTEAEWGDRDLKMARGGASMLAVHCPTEPSKKAAWSRIEPFHPLAARYYSLGLGGIEHLAGDPGTA